MRVLSVAYSGIPAGTAFGGGAEQILSCLESALVRQGHQSVVIAGKGSRVAGNLVEISSSRSSAGCREAIRCALRKHDIDLIHFHGLDFHHFLPECHIPMLATLHLPISLYPSDVFEDRQDCLVLNCVSWSQARSAPVSRNLPVILNGVPVEQYVPAEPQQLLVFLGRICEDKGVHIALEVAHRLDLDLVIAGPVYPYPEHQEYFFQRINPFLDHKRRYVGPVEGEEKRALLAHAKCVLVPSLIPETSSLVAMEALSSGTPVIAFRTGALPEIVQDGETGFLVESGEEMWEAVSRIRHVSRERCRKEAVDRFDAGRMIREYLELYGRMTTRHFETLCAPQENL